MSMEDVREETHEMRGGGNKEDVSISEKEQSEKERRGGEKGKEDTGGEKGKEDTGGEKGKDETGERTGEERKGRRREEENPGLETGAAIVSDRGREKNNKQKQRGVEWIISGS